MTRNSRDYEKATMPNNGQEYRTLKTQIRNKCRSVKEEWLNEKCEEIKRTRIKKVCAKELRKNEQDKC